MIEPSHPRYRPAWQMLREVYERYRRPLFIAETGIEDEARPAWLRYVGYEVRWVLSRHGESRTHPAHVARALRRALPSPDVVLVRGAEAAELVERLGVLG
jgi:hypothetical protein